jgi:hypothetical protein
MFKNSMFKRRKTMREQTWSRKTIAGGAVALALAAAVLIPMGAGAHPFYHRVVSAHVAAQASIPDGPAGAAVEPDPIDDGSIIVECVALAAVLNANQPQAISNMGLVTVPRNPLGPLMCWPQEHRRVP